MMKEKFDQTALIILVDFFVHAIINVVYLNVF